MSSGVRVVDRQRPERLDDAVHHPHDLVPSAQLNREMTMNERERQYRKAHELWAEMSDPPETALSRAVRLLGLLVVRLEANGALSESDVLELRKITRGDVPELK